MCARWKQEAGAGCRGGNGGIIFGVERIEGSLSKKASLEISEAVRVKGAAHLGGVAHDLTIVAGTLVSGGVANLAIREAT